MTRLSELTTTQVGGEAKNLVAPATRDELVAAAGELFANYEQPLVLGGGSNTIATDDRIDEPVLHVVTKGIHQLDGPGSYLGQSSGCLGMPRGIDFVGVTCAVEAFE